jgi:hypothetical protein
VAERPRAPAASGSSASLPLLSLLLLMSSGMASPSESSTSLVVHNPNWCLRELGCELRLRITGLLGCTGRCLLQQRARLGCGPASGGWGSGNAAHPAGGLLLAFLLALRLADRDCGAVLFSFFFSGPGLGVACELEAGPLGVDLLCVKSSSPRPLVLPLRLCYCCHCCFVL